MLFKLCVSKLFHGIIHHYVLVSLTRCAAYFQIISNIIVTFISELKKEINSILYTICYLQTKKKRSRASSYSFTESALGALLSRQVQTTSILSLQKVIRMHDLLYVSEFSYCATLVL